MRTVPTAGQLHRQAAAVAAAALDVADQLTAAGGRLPEATRHLVELDLREIQSTLEEIGAAVDAARNRTRPREPLGRS